MAEYGVNMDELDPKNPALLALLLSPSMPWASMLGQSTPQQPLEGKDKKAEVRNADDLVTRLAKAWAGDNYGNNGNPFDSYSTAGLEKRPPNKSLSQDAGNPFAKGSPLPQDRRSTYPKPIIPHLGIYDPY